ncbi:5-oxoprolinase subunit PxpB [Bosea sp. (in: a-proteobacteria)]|uniref:5-oxoprolinase subunit PxpB n=1 Tax=Bosea sp. (in: a-proteobacteria) TaxID=1871050 RepID=UPI0026119F9F|nr:5-oxoprolinase subunit PxpB [Bosea sp. (in: a-proteobacteria)]MCO5089946.1 5-oxoprolinase subunit PxpB [Bosea sp. (in: a-proteobacteria)]
MTRATPAEAGEKAAAASEIRLLSFGDTALTVEFGSVIDAGLNARVLALDAALASEAPRGVLETVPTYRSLLVIFDPLVVDLPGLKTRIRALAASDIAVKRSARRWRVPVVYGGAFGMDLEATAAVHGLSAEELIGRHQGATYTVAMIGFMPGFAYLSGLDPALATPRRPEPRQLVPAQSVSIGGAQCAISSVEGPSGWHMLGRTPVRGFMPQREPVFLYEPGDAIRFERIAADEWPALDQRAAAGEPVAVSEP